MVSYRPISGAETAPGEALAGVGSSLMRSGDYLFQVAKHEKEKADTLRAEDAFNQLREKQLDLTAGEQNGFVQKKGADVARTPTFFKDHSAKLSDVVKQLSDTLTPEQKIKFKHRADVATYQFQHDILNHITKENGTYAEQVYKGVVEQERMEATARWQDPNAIALSIARTQAAVNREADRVGAPPEYREATLLTEESKIHGSVIAQMLANNDYKRAGAWLEQNKGRIDATVSAHVQKALKDGTEKEAFNNYQREFIEQGRDVPSLNELEKRVAADPTLKEDRQNLLLGRIDNRRTMLINQQIASHDRTVRQLRAEIGRVDNDIKQGYEPSLETLAPLFAAAKGTEVEGEMQRLINHANLTSKFRRTPAMGREAFLSQLDAQVRKDPAKFDIGMVKGFEAIHKSMVEQARENPVGFVVKQGFVDPSTPGAGPLDFAKPEAIDLPARFLLARQAARDHSVPVKPLQPAEVAMLTNAVRNMPPEAKRDYFGKLALSSKNDFDGYKAMMNQIAPDDPVTAAGGIAAMRGLTTDKGRVLADVIFRGQAYMNPPKKEDGSPVGQPVQLPPEKKMVEAFNNKVGDAFDGKPEARNIYLQTARAIYAEKMVSGNNYKGKGDQSGELNSTVWQASINMALGAEPVSRNGRYVIPPPGMDSGQFKDAIDERLKAVAPRLPKDVPLERARNLPLENVGDGVYAIRSGDSKLMGNDGKPIVIDLNRPSPAPERRTTTQPVDIDRRVMKADVVGSSSRGQIHQRNIAELEREISKSTDVKKIAIWRAEIASERQQMQAIR